MKMTWLRYLNPFYFEVRFLKWTAWANIMVSCLLLALTLVMLLHFGPSFLKLGNRSELTVEQLDKISDVAKLKRMVLIEDHFNHLFLRDSAHVIEALAFVFVGIILTLLGTAFYLHKAYRWLSAKTVEANISVGISDKISSV